MKNKISRKRNFLKQTWSKNNKSNFVLRYKGKYITIMKSKYNPNVYGVAFADGWHWDFNGNKIRGFENAKKVAFEFFDKYSKEEYEICFLQYEKPNKTK